MGFPSKSAVGSLSAMQEMQVQSLGQEDALRKRMATLYSILPWEIPWTEEPSRSQELDMAYQLNHRKYIYI